MDVKICRVCLETSEPMANIFDGIPDHRISIANMISQCTGFPVSRWDAFPKTICSPCKEDATNAYEIKQLYETSLRTFCQIKKDFKEEQDLLDEDICEIAGYEDTGTSKAHYIVKKEEIGKDSVEEGVSGRDEFYGQVKNEPIEEDIFEEDHLYISDCDVDQLHFEVKCEEFNDYAQKDYQRYDDTNNHEDKAEHLIKDIQHPHRCSYCQKFFAGVGGLKEHIRIHTGERPYKCSHCKKFFSRHSYLLRHIRTHTGERSYECSHCQKSFSQWPYLKRHLMIHTGERPYKCSHCQKSFSQKINLQVHFRIHTGERPYKCTYCKKSFYQNGALQSHIRTHTGEKPYKCSHCQKSFKHKPSLRKHIQTHSKEKIHKCSHCQKSFFRMMNLKRHLMTHTNPIILM